MLHQLLHEKTAQVSIVSGVLFFVIASQPVFKFVEDLLKKVLNVSLSGTPLLLLHSVLFAVLVSVLTFHVFRPLLGLSMEGMDPAINPCAAGFVKDENNECVAENVTACSLNAECADDEYCDGMNCKKGARTR